MNSNINQPLKISRTTFLKDPIDAFEIMVPSSKEKRKASSASKLRSKITHHSPSAPFQKEKSSSIIQKHLDRIISVHNTFTNDKRNSEGNIQKPKNRPQSSKLRKGVTYRSLNKPSRKRLDLKQVILCENCKEKQNFASKCGCGSQSKILSFPIEIRSILNTDKFQLLIGKKEFIVSSAEPMDLVVKLENNEKKIVKSSKSPGLCIKEELLLESVHVNTPSFQAVSERFLDTGSYKGGCHINEFEVSFAEGHEEFDGIVKSIHELNEMLGLFISGHNNVKGFSQRIDEVIEGIEKMCGEYVREHLESLRKIISSYFCIVVSKESEPRLLHKKLDLRLGSKSNTSAGFIQNTSKQF